MEKKLGILGALSILVFIISSLALDLSTMNNTFLGKAIIGFVVIGGITPWIYLIEKSKGKVSNKQLAIYFIGCWLLAPYFLFKLHTRKNNTH